MVLHQAIDISLKISTDKNGMEEIARKIQKGTETFP